MMDLEPKPYPPNANLWQRLIPFRYRTLAKICVGIFVATSALLGTLRHQATSAPLTVRFFNVGQGDGILIHTDNGIDIVIDGGPTPKQMIQKLDSVLPFYDRTIELMILTHPHSDHVNGLVEVLKRYQVDHVVGTGIIHTTDAYLEWLQLIKDKNIPFTIGTAGGKFTFKDKEGKDLVLTILYPITSLEGTKAPNDHMETGGGLNDTSIVARLDYGTRSFLFTGDASSVIEEQLIKSSQLCNYSSADTCQLSTVNVHADVLKVGHHGSRYSSSPEFVKTVAPTYAVIQVGAKNKYGHPTYRTLHTLEQAGIKMFRNDRNGDVVATTDGTTLEVKSEK